MSRKFIVRRRTPTRDEARKLVRAIRDTPKISAYPVSAWLASRHALVAELEDGTLAGGCLNDDFYGNWTEIAVLFVFEEFRALGIGGALLTEARAVLEEHRRHTLIMSDNPLVTKLLTRHRFQVVPSLDTLPHDLQPHRAALTWIYNLRWWWSAYRIKEVVRKRFVFGRQTSYTYGIALADGTGGARRESVPPSTR